MAILQMRQIDICALKSDRKKIMEKLQSMGVVEVAPMKAEEGLERMDTQTARQQFDRTVQQLEQALGVLDEYAPQKQSLLASFAGKEVIERQDLMVTIHKRDKTVDKAGSIVKKAKSIAENKAQIQKLENQIEFLRPWQSLGIPMNYKGTEKTAVFIGTMPAGTEMEAVYKLIAEKCEGDVPCDVNIIGGDQDGVNLAVMCLKENEKEVEDALRSGGFARPSQPTHRVPSDKIDRLGKQIEELKEKNGKLEQQIKDMAKDREELRRASDYFRTRSEKYAAYSNTSQSESVFFMHGYVPEEAAPAVEKVIGEEFGAAVEISPLDEDDPGPTLLRNNKFSESVEGVLESYGLPTKGHVDPSFIMSFFYVIFFGMMFSDGGYGIIMLAVCGIVLLKYGKTLSESLHKMVKLFFWCGISTAFWGFMYGSFFGDVIDVIGRTFFGYTGEGPILKPLWFEPMAEPMRLLVWCMFFGLIHLFFGLGIKGWEYLKAKDYVGFVSDILSWFLFIIGLILLLLPSDLFGSIAGEAFDFSGLAAYGTVAKVLTLIGLALILVMQERSQKNWVLRILLGAYDVYGVSGWLSDVLSYSRLLALGLATGVIAQVINMMGSMGGKTVFGVIMFIIVFIVGHALNFAINVLGAYVHTNRLQFVEFFGKFYDGGGRPFKAFQTANKYTEIKEER
ncbi:MAG: V-type ATP synthase subunit I [Lachnospiraceae bacterium]|nr:V-type ATP synthase subunit I [Lachnospiraceae bacterium]